MNEMISRTEDVLKAAEFARLPGKCLYSSPNTLKPGKIYLLGLNPGGDTEKENRSIIDEFLEWRGRPNDWSEYADAEWRPGGRVYPRGMAPLQRKITDLLEYLGLGVRETCASNVIFVRSVDGKSIKNANYLADQAWPVHVAILGCVRPSGVLVLGDKAFKHLIKRVKKVGSVDEIDSGHRGYACRAVDVDVYGQRTALVSVPHPAGPCNFEPKNSLPALKWVRARLGL